ncbi:MAG: glycosyltransferase family 39 protein [DPANN group archaeon]|nr:glycosyltransferase family 39 protein [DPANN group archaeon]
MTDKKFFIKLRNYKYLILLIILALILRFAWIDTIIERDEGTFGQVAWRMSNDELLYKDIAESKPPGIFVIYLASTKLLGNNIYSARIVNNILFLLSILILFQTTKKLYNKKTALWSLIAYIFFMNIPFYEGQLAMAESFLVYFIIFSFYFIIKYLETKNNWFLIISGISFFIAITIKQSAMVWIIPSLYLLLKEKKNRTKNVLLFLSPTIILGFIIIAFYLAQNIFHYLRFFLFDFLILRYNKGGFYRYVELDYWFFIISQGFIMWTLVTIWITNTIKKFKEKKVLKKDTLIFLWFISFFITTLIPPSFGHYFLMVVPPASIMAGSILSKNIKNKKFYAIIIIILAISIISQSIQWKDFPINKGNINIPYSGFDSKQEQKETINFLKHNLNENETFIAFGWSPEIYWLTKREPPGISVFDFQEYLFIRKTSNEKVKYILIFEEREEKFINFNKNKKINKILDNYFILREGNPKILELKQKTI